MFKLYYRYSANLSADSRDFCKIMVAMRKARNVGSGLAGSGRRTREISEEKEDYLTGMENIYSGIDTKRAGALQSIYNVIEDYQGLI